MVAKRPEQYDEIKSNQKKQNKRPAPRKIVSNKSLGMPDIYVLRAVQSTASLEMLDQECGVVLPLWCMRHGG
jgi:hypothetical protein